MVILGLFFLLLGLVIGIPVPFAFLLTAMYFLLTGDYEPTFMVPYAVKNLSNTVIFCIPLFILAGKLMERGNIADKLIGLVEESVGRVKGGLGIVATVSCAVFGSVTGSAAATLTCIGSIMIPRLEKAGYPRGHSTSLLANSAVLGMLIPPSGIMILYSWMGGQSVLASFLATVIPGIALTSLFSLINCFLLRKDPNIVVPVIPEADRTAAHKILRLKKASPALMMPVIILGGIYSGIMTPTEAAAVAVVYAIPVGMFIYRGLTLKGIKETLIDSGMATGTIMIMMFGCSVLARMFVEEDLPGAILQLLYSISTNKYVILLMLNLFMIILGMLVDDTSAVLLATPIMIPIITEIGVSPVQFAAIVAVNSGMGNITPPCAPLLYLAGAVAKCPINETLRVTCYLLFFGWLPILILVTYFPAFSMWLPGLVLGIR